MPQARGRAQRLSGRCGASSSTSVTSWLFRWEACAPRASARRLSRLAERENRVKTGREGEASSESGRSFVSVVNVVAVLSRATQSITTLAFAACLTLLTGCGEEGFFPTTVDPGTDYSIAELRWDENFFYCQVEPRTLSASSCATGMAGDTAGGCHQNVTAFRVSFLMHMPLRCDGNTPLDFVPQEARQNYNSSNARMARDPEVAPLLQRPLKKLAHPRQIFNED